MILYKSSGKFSNKHKKILSGISRFELGFLLLSLLIIIASFFHVDFVRTSSKGNSIGFSYYSGFYIDPIDVSLRQYRVGSEVRYTLDGSEPNSNSQLYDKSIPINKTTVLRAALFDEGIKKGKTQSQTYFFNEFSSLPVISLISDPSNLWDKDTGIYVQGEPHPDSDEKFVPNFAQRGTDWRKPAYIEYFDEEGELKFNSRGEIKIHGNTTRSFPQKTLRFCTEKGEPQIEYKLFKDSDTRNFKCILLRSSGNDWKDTLFRDAMVQKLFSETKLDLQNYQPSILFINGEYWGIHNIREFQDEYYFQNKYNIDRNNVVILYPDRSQNGYPVIEAGDEGDELHYLNMLDFLKSSDMTIKENYEHVQTLMDVDNFIDYNILQIYSNNSDWIDSNLKIWRYKNDTIDFDDDYTPYGLDGRWRWIVYDMDEAFNFSSGSTNRLNRILKSPPEIIPPWGNLIIKSLLKNEEFKEKFTRRFVFHYNSTYLPERVIPIIDSFETGIEAEIPRHAVKWGNKVIKGDWVSFKNIDAWRANIQVMRDFTLDRRKHALNQVVLELKYTGTANLDINMNLQNAGRIYLDSLEIRDSLWQGIYVKNVPYKLSVKSNPGYRFKGWTGDAYATGDGNSIVFTKDEIYLTANFEKTLLGDILSFFNLIE